jgi:hypothetical protein
VQVLSEVLAASSVVVALIALLRLAALHRKFSTLSQSYWDLQYEFGRLRARVAKLDHGETGPDAEGPQST